MIQVAQSTIPNREPFAKYPPHAVVTSLNSTFEIKQAWLYSEWDSNCQFSKYIRPHFAKRKELNPRNKNPNTKLIESTFHQVRGKWLLWQAPRENGRWKKVVIASLSPDWVRTNVEILYPTKDHFKVPELNGIVLWRDKSKKGKRYQLYDGNHRISAWLASQQPPHLPATIYIGKPRKVIQRGTCTYITLLILLLVPAFFLLANFKKNGGQI